MALNISSAITALPAAQPATKMKAEKAAQDFEAVLLTSLLDSLQKSFAGTADESSAGSDSYAAMGTQALASAISAHGGIGIAGMILRQWQHAKVPEFRAAEVPPAT